MGIVGTIETVDWDGADSANEGGPIREDVPEEVQVTDRGGERQEAPRHERRHESRVRGADDAPVIDEAEHLTRDLARVRAKFGLDPALAPRSFDAAWMTETVMEEDEAEFVDTVADCLGAGLSLDDALTCWDTGDLATEMFDDAAAVDPDEDGEEPSVLAVERNGTSPTGGHRLFVR